MHTERRKLLTIVAEAALEQRMTRDVERLGAHGYTITAACGKGSRGVRNADWERNSNIRMEVVCDATTAAAIASTSSMLRSAPTPAPTYSRRLARVARSKAIS